MVDPDVPALLPHSHNPEVVFAAELGLNEATVLYIKTLSFFNQNTEGKIRHDQTDSALKPILNTNNVISIKKSKVGCNDQ